MDEDDLDLLKSVSVSYKNTDMTQQDLFISLTCCQNFVTDQKRLPGEGWAAGLERDVPCPVASEGLGQLWDFCLLSE